jgi:hypothetical protein
MMNLSDIGIPLFENGRMAGVEDTVRHIPGDDSPCSGGEFRSDKGQLATFGVFLSMVLLLLYNPLPFRE